MIAPKEGLKFYALLLLLKTIDAVIHSGSGNFLKHHHHHPDYMIHKVTFTQKGYIQFLRYVAEVPPLTDYTFCIWVRSHNLTYSHPLLSYSKHEEERLIRVWISPQGRDINLEILEVPIFKIPIKIVENHWYHVCQSWSSHQATWNLYLNGKLKSSGFEPKMRGVKIKGGGDLVVGQEYTDFDKGLEDGIEGDVFGFNFVLSATSDSAKSSFPLRRHYDTGVYRLPVIGYSPPRPAEDVPNVLGYFSSIGPNRTPKGFLQDYFGDVLGVFDSSPIRIVVDDKSGQFASRIINDVEDYGAKPSGLRLVELSYNKCFLGRGAPISGKDVLISWTRTPVRVFGGAILKSVPPFCT